MADNAVPGESAKKPPSHIKKLIEKEIQGKKTFHEKMREFATENNIGEDVLKRYVYKTAPIPDGIAKALAEKYGVTGEWLMDRPLNDYDVIEILKAFASVLRVGVKKEPFYQQGKLKGHLVRTLYIDEKFFAFLSVVKSLQYEKNTDVSLDDETFSRRMEHIISHYKDYFEVKFRTHTFDESRALEIENLEFL